MGALTERCAATWHDWHEEDRRGEIEHVEAGAVDELGVSRRRIKHPSDNPPEDYVAGAAQRFQRLTSLSSRLESAGGPIVVTSNHRKSFRRLHDLRDNFTHFSPKGWSIDVECIQDVMRDVLDIIEPIEQDDGPFRHREGEDRTRLRQKIAELRVLLSER